MSRVLVSLDELADALRTVPHITIDGEQHLDGAQLLEAITAITRGIVVPARERSSAVPEIPGGLDLAASVAASEAFEPSSLTAAYVAERQRLDALPPGKCVCGHVAHGEQCPECRCVDYVDMTVRDPIQAAMDRGDAPALASFGVDTASGPHGGPPHTGGGIIDEEFSPLRVAPRLGPRGSINPGAQPPESIPLPPRFQGED